jgi:zinc protease
VSTVNQTTLDNGLTVLLKEVHSAPVISSWAMYRVGSRNEPTGLTGASHWVEHMMFKGTDKFPMGVLDKTIDRCGGQWNAFTSSDYTMYYETLPASHIDLALEAEADRMANALFEPEEVESERTVIISERQGAENSPMFWLNEQMRATAFRVHGYGHEILGDLADLQTMTRNDLYNHYRRHYMPRNAVLAIVGAFDSDKMLEKVERFFGDIPGGEAPTLFSRSEPAQIGERRIVIERPGHTAFLKFAYHVPNAMHGDWFALETLDSVLAGPGGGVDNKTSRLYQALVKGEIAAGLGGGLSESIDPNLYTVTLTLRDGRTLEEAETALIEQIDRVVTNGITQKELDKAKKQARAAFAYSTESVTNQGYWLEMSAALGDYRWNDQYVAKLSAVTVEDVQAAAQRYFTAQNRTVGWLVPTGMGE